VKIVLERGVMIEILSDDCNKLVGLVMLG